MHPSDRKISKEFQIVDSTYSNTFFQTGDCPEHRYILVDVSPLPNGAYVLLTCSISCCPSAENVGCDDIELLAKIHINNLRNAALDISISGILRVQWYYYKNNRNIEVLQCRFSHTLAFPTYSIQLNLVPQISLQVALCTWWDRISGG